MTTNSQFRSPAPCADSMNPWPSRYGSPTPESTHQPDLFAQRRMSIAGTPSFTHGSVDAPRGDYVASRRLSAPHLDIRDLPPLQGPSDKPPPPKPSKAPLNLKLFPWMTRKESSPPPPRDTSNDMIKCSYPSNDCAETLPGIMVTWRKHLAKKHGLVKDSVPQMCQWPECGMMMGGRSLNRHVLTRHMDLRPSCPHCKVRRRYDHMDKHVLNCPAHPARGVGGK